MLSSGIDHRDTPIIVLSSSCRTRNAPLRELPRNALFGAERGNDQAVKRKAASNPFARRPKVQKEQA